MRKPIVKKNCTHGKPIAIYDPAILDIIERKDKVLLFNTASSAATYLGVDRRTISNYSSHEAVRKQLRYRNKDGKQYIIRELSQEKFRILSGSRKNSSSANDKQDNHSHNEIHQLTTP